MYHLSCNKREMNCVSFNRSHGTALMSCSHFPFRFDTTAALVVREMSKMVCRFVACDVLSEGMQWCIKRHL